MKAVVVLPASETLTVPADTACVLIRLLSVSVCLTLGRGPVGSLVPEEHAVV